MANITVPGAGTQLVVSAFEGGQGFPAAGLLFGPAGALERVTAANPMPVAGPLTDTQLRAAAVPVSGSVTASGIFTMSGALPAGGNAIGSVEVSAVPSRAIPTRSYSWASGAAVSVAATSARTAAGIAATEVLVCSSTDCFIAVGSASVVATAGAGSLFLAAGVPMHLQITSGQYVAAIRLSADGTLTILPVN